MKPVDLSSERASNSIRNITSRIGGIGHVIGDGNPNSALHIGPVLPRVFHLLQTQNHDATLRRS